MVKVEEINCRWQAWKCPRLLARSIGAIVLVSVIIPGLNHSPPVAAAMLEMPGRQVLSPGQPLRLPLVIDATRGPRIEISLGAAPEGASLVLEDDGQLQLEWLAGADLADETTIELLIRDIDSNEYLNSVFVVIRRPGEGSAPEAAPDTAAQASGQKASPDISTETASGDPPASVPASSAGERQDAQTPALEVPGFGVLPNQVVSVGRIVSLDVSASLSGELYAVLQIDRLPRNASFEAHEGGGRTFRWETSDDDEGEHLFRFTAFNPRAPDKRATKEVWVVVGDPSKKTTLPEPLSSD